MRVECPHAELCTGCPLISLDYEEQLHKKTETLARALAIYPSLASHPIDAIVAADPVRGYRVRAKLVVGTGGAIGLFAAEAHSLVRVEAREGKKHQIRRHLAGLGHPLIGDDRYGHAPTKSPLRGEARPRPAALAPGTPRARNADRRPAHPGFEPTSR